VAIAALAGGLTGGFALKVRALIQLQLTRQGIGAGAVSEGMRRRIAQLEAQHVDGQKRIAELERKGH
jgi:hypothetical protein